jgi:probable phosphoglycerate mutase
MPAEPDEVGAAQADPRHAHPVPTDGSELILVRHGQSTANAQGIGQGRSDWPLSDLGCRQAEATGRRLALLGGIAAVYTSPLSRAAATAQAIATPLGLTPTPNPELVEIDIGALSGKTWDQLKIDQPDALAAYEAAEAARPHPRNRELIPGWEPAHAVLARTWRAIKANAAQHPGQRVVVVAHGGVFNAYLTHLLTGDARVTPWSHHLGNCAVTHLAFRPDGVQTVCLRDTSHLRDLRSAAGVPPWAR